ncbi:MAG TPA: hypothetical protein VGC96_02445 [Candidatus Elarobacter sp.]|jgi:hypothetical protein
MDLARRSGLAGVLLAAALLASCAHNAATRPESARPERLANPSSFPLYPGSRVTTVVPVDSSQMTAAMKASDPHASVPKNFRGHEIIAETGASMKELGTWLATLRRTPPPGLRKPADRGWNMNDRTASGQPIQAGEQFASATGDRTVYVIAADPRKLHDQLGPVFTLIESYNAVPGVLRAPLDDQAKKQVGYSISEMLDAKSPVGAIVAAVKRMQSSNRRAILLIDETRAK